MLVDVKMLREQASELGKLADDGKNWAEGLWNLCHALLDEAERQGKERVIALTVD